MAGVLQPKQGLNSAQNEMTLPAKSTMKKEMAKESKSPKPIGKTPLNARYERVSADAKDKTSPRATMSKAGSIRWPPFSSHEQVLANRGYTLTQELGEGSYAKVKKGQSKIHHCQVAVKIIDQAKAPTDFREKFLPRELKVHRVVKHDSIIKLLDLFRIGYRIYMVMELAGHGDLLDFVRLRGAIAESEAKIMFRQMCEAMSYLHLMGVVHRDLKCENLLLDIYNNIKLSDFGFAREYNEATISKTYCGSAAYAAPEILRGTPYKPVVYDMWSLGVILFIMVNGTMPFDDTNLKKMVRSQETKRIHFSNKVAHRLSPHAKDLIFALLEPNVDKRAGVQECIDSSWLEGVPYIIRDSSSTEIASVKEPLAKIIAKASSSTKQPKVPKITSPSAAGPKPKQKKSKSKHPPTELPAGFVASSTRRLAYRDRSTRSQTSVAGDKELEKPQNKLATKQTSLKPSPSSMLKRP